MAETDDVKTLEPIRARHAAASLGPWKWFGYLSNHDVSLEGRGVTVMDFVRWGMFRAQPRWSVKGLLEKLADLVVPDTAEGRGRVTDINHPDARFIASSWQDVRDLLGMVDALQAQVAQLTRERDSEMEERWKVSEVRRQQEARAENAESERDAALTRVNALEEHFADEAVRDVRVARMGPGRTRQGTSSFSMTFTGARELLLRMADALVTFFKGEGGTNYVEAKLHHPEEGDFVLCVQRSAGKTPHELRRDAESERDAAVEWIGVIREELVRAGGAGGDRTVALANLRAMVSERDALRAFAESFATTAEVAVAAHRAPKTGMQVHFHGDFAHVQPSVVGRLEWWARQARAAMAPRAEEPRSPQQHACPTGDVCPTCDEPEVPRG